MPLLKIKYFATITLMTERNPKQETQLRINALTDRSSSIDQRHTFIRGGYEDPNSGSEYNPVLEIKHPLFNQQEKQVLHVKHDEAPSQLEAFAEEL